PTDRPTPTDRGMFSELGRLCSRNWPQAFPDGAQPLNAGEEGLRAATDGTGNGSRREDRREARACSRPALGVGLIPSAYDQRLKARVVVSLSGRLATAEVKLGLYRGRPYSEEIQRGEED